MKSRKRNAAIRARLGSDRDTAVIELRGTRLDALFLLNGIINKLAEATNIPIDQLLNDLRECNAQQIAS